MVDATRRKPLTARISHRRKFARRLGAAVSMLSFVGLLLEPIAVQADVAQIDIGMSVAAARAALQAGDIKIGVDNDDQSWHILIAQQAAVTLNLLFENDRLRYVSYDFYHAAHALAEETTVGHCNRSFDAAVAVIERSYGKGNLTRTMSWPEREFAMTWRGPQHYAIVRELSDLNNCLLVKAMVFDGNETEFKAFDKRLKAP
jgi:hypothetical protein